MPAVGGPPNRCCSAIIEVRHGPENHSRALFEQEASSCFPIAPLPPRRGAAVRAGRPGSKIAGGPGVKPPRPRHVGGAPAPHHRPARAERQRAESRLLRADSGRRPRLCTGSWSARTAELAPELDEDFRMMRLVVSVTFFPSYGLALGSGDLIRRPVADRAFSAVAAAEQRASKHGNCVLHHISRHTLLPWSLRRPLPPRFCACDAPLARAARIHRVRRPCTSQLHGREGGHREHQVPRRPRRP
eukprot:COSAG04_NODE_596_length_12255_cov_4.614018_6_plen_244_part_00